MLNKPRLVTITMGCLLDGFTFQATEKRFGVSFPHFQDKICLSGLFLHLE